MAARKHKTPNSLKQLVPYRLAYMSARALPFMFAFRRLNKTRDQLTDAEVRAQAAALHAQAADLVFDIAQNLEGITIKAAQFAGARGEILPTVYQDRLGSFHDNVPPHEFGVMRPLIEKAIGGPISETFKQFDDIPVAAASLSQVYKAMLRDGRHVAVKIQYPEAKSLFNADGKILTMLAAMGKLIAGTDTSLIVKDLVRHVKQELDFEQELAAQQLAARNFANTPGVIIPAPYPDLSNDTVLVMDWIDGTALTDIDALPAAQKADLARLIAQAYRDMVVNHRQLHGDPHPGNMIYTDDGKLCLLDFGMARPLPPHFAKGLALLIGAARIKSIRHAQQGADLIGVKGTAQDLELLIEFLHDLISGALAARETANAQIALPAAPPPISASLHIPAEVTLIVRTLSLLDGLSSRLTPGAPIMQNIIMEGLLQTLNAAPDEN